MDPMNAIESLFGQSSGASGSSGSEGGFMQEMMQMMQEMEQLLQGGGQAQSQSQGKSGGDDVLGSIGGIVKDIAPLALAFL